MKSISDQQSKMHRIYMYMYKSMHFCNSFWYSSELIVVFVQMMAIFVSFSLLYAIVRKAKWNICLFQCLRNRVIALKVRRGRKFLQGQ